MDSQGDTRLRDRTLELLKNRNQYMKDIAAATGLNQKWIEGFHNDQYQDPGVSKVLKLYEYLSGHKLKIK